MDINSFSNIKNPVFATDSGFSINITCDIAGIGVGILFTAMDADPEPYGHQLYTAALAGAYGTVAHYAAPVSVPNLLSQTRDKETALNKLIVDVFKLQCAVDTNTATKEQNAQLEDLKKQVVLLS